MSRLLLFAAAFILLPFRPALAFDKPGHAHLPDFDKRSAPEVQPERVAAAERLKVRLPYLHVDYDRILGTPKMVVARDGFLSGPRGRGRGVAPQVADALPENEPLQPLKAFLKEHRELFGHSEEPLAEARVKRQHVSKHNGLRSYAWQQEFDGIEVAGAVLSAHITRDAELVGVSSQFIGQLEAAAEAGTPARRRLQFNPAFTASQAVRIAAENVGENVEDHQITLLNADLQAKDKRQTFKAGNLPGEAEARLVWLPLSGTALRLCWEIEITRRAGGERFRLHIDAETGEALTRYQLTRYLADASYNVYTGDSPTPFSPGHSTPLTNQPPLVPRTMVTIGALSTNASPTGWIHPGENETRGNNVDAHLDRNADDLPDLPRPQGNPFRVFDFPIDFSQPPSTYGDAAAVQLFYWCNWLHDTLYELGFTESAGNFQKDNFGRGGLGNDPMLADAQDGSGTDNANYTPTPDGKPPRIQMYTFSGPEPDRDGDFDAEIIIHEYVHGLSDRLVGGGGGLLALQSGGLGEGWSDFYALALLSESGEDPHATYAMGGYATLEFFGLQENYYFGIRRYPYSTDLLKNPLTFKDIDPTQAIPHTGVPLNPRDTFNPAFAAEVHNSGEVWCVTLWEMRANLVDKYGFAGNHLALQLITDGMKLTPRNPNFLHARDGIILADQINNGGANFNEIWRAFAKRGMGFSATSPDSTTTVGLHESFDLPDALLIIPSSAFIASAAAGSAPAPNCKTYVITNHSEAALSWSASTDESWITVSPASGSLAPKSGATVSICLNAAAAQLGFGTHSAAVTFSNATSGIVQEREVSLRVMAFTSLPFTENFESGQFASFWQVSGTESFRSQITDQNTPRGQRHLTLDNVGNGVNSRNEVTLGIDLAGYTNVLLRFWAKQFGDEPDGPPPAPFVGGADFDGVAISANGIEWYEVQGLRSIPFNYTEFRVNLDEAIARFGLSYSQRFMIRFNEFDNFSIPIDGLAIDDISITGVPAQRLALGLPAEATEGQAPPEGTASIGLPLAADLLVQLAASDTSKLRLPASVIIPAGSTQAVFTLDVIDNRLVDGSQSATVTASAAGFFGVPQSIILHDNESNRLTVKVWPSSAGENSGFQRKLGLVFAQKKPARDVQVSLTSSNPDEVSVPASVTLPAGRHSASFSVFIIDDSRLDGSRSTTITAHVENWEDGSDTIQVRDNDVPQMTVSLPLQASEGNGVLSNAGSIHLTATHPTNLIVSLASSAKAELTVPSFIEVPAGKSTVLFDLAVSDDTEPDGIKSVTVTASAPGYASAAAIMDILDDEMPPAPYQPVPAHQSTGNPISTDLRWFGGVGEIVRNGGFETGDFTGWSLLTSGFGGFTITDGKLDPEGPDLPTAPFEGNFSVLTEQIGGGNHVLYQEILIPAETRAATLSWVDKIRNHSTQYDVNQFFRVEIRDPANDVMDVAFTTAPGFPLTNDWTRRSYDLTRFRGQTILIAFVEEDHQGYFNVYLDNVSIQLADNGVTTYDVYLGTNSTLTASNFLGNSPSNSWALPDLALSTTYYWQIISRRGASTTAGPVWEFTTRAVGAVDRLEFSPVSLNQLVNQPFAATLSARDDINNIASSFTGPVQLRAYRGGSNSSAVVITELDPGTNDRIEFQNVSGRKIDISNWQVFSYDTRSWPAPRHVFTMPTNTIVQPGAVFFLSGSGTAPGRYPSFLMGTNLNWTLGVISNYIAILMRDAAGQPVDFFCTAEARADRITSPAVISQAEWSGPPIPVNTNANLTYQRVGATDTGSAADWILATNTLGRRNDTLSVPLSPRFPIPISPSVLSNFSGGVWTGELTFNEPAPAITIIAEDANRHFGVAGTFAAAAANDVALSVTDSPDVVLIGDDLAYRFTITNSGPSEASVTFSNRFPAGLQFVSATSSHGTWVTTPDGVFYDFSTIPGHSSASITFVFTSTVAGAITNTAGISVAGSDTFPGNNVATEHSTIIYPVLATGVVVVNEGHTNSTNLTFTLRLDAPCRLPVTVEYRTFDVSATAGVDYTPGSGVVIFAPGVTNRPVTIAVLGDRFDELTEQFTLELFNPINCAIATPQIRGRITDDDPTPLLIVTDAAVVEPAPGAFTDVVFEVRLSAPSALPVSVVYSTTNGTALSARDYFTVFGQLELPPGVTNSTFSVRVIGDSVFETNELFGVRLVSPVNALLGDPLGIATITDNGFVDLDHFRWEPIASPQVVGIPFNATITARDGRGDLYPAFIGNVRISGVSSTRSAEVGPATNNWEFPMSTLFHDARSQVIYLASEVGAPGKINALALNVTTAPGQTLSNWTIRLKHTSLTAYPRAEWDDTGWSVVYRHHEPIQGIGWVTFFFDQPFDYNGSDNLIVDLSYENSSYSSDGICAAWTAPANRSLVFQTDSAFGDPLDWSGNAPPPTLSRRVPQARFTIENFVNVEPAQAGPFVNGSWTGQLSVLEPGTNIFLRALHDSGRSGGSAAFRVDGSGTAPLAPAVRIASVLFSGADVKIRFLSVAGHKYCVESTEALANPNWRTISDNVPGTGSLMDVIDARAAAQPQRFYRVRILD